MLLLDNLQGVTSRIKSDHILNLFQEVEGRLPEDMEKMTAPIRSFLDLKFDQQLLYLVGRRCGIFCRLTDMHDGELRRHAEKAMVAHHVTLDNVEKWAAAMMQRFI